MATTKQKHRKTRKNILVSNIGLAARVALVEKSQMRTDFPLFRAGDTVRVHVRIKEGEKERIQAFEGVVIARDGGGANKTFVVRKISSGVGVERIFMETSIKIAKLEVVEQGRVRRAKLYYLRGLEGKAAKIERVIETAASAAAKVKSKAGKTT